MTGNLFQWCLDGYGDYPTGPCVDPAGASDESLRVLRGGSWLRGAWHCRAAYRARLAPLSVEADVGLRVVLVLE